MREIVCGGRMRVVVLVAVLLAGMTACSSDDDGGGGSAFRNLGKRGDSSVGTTHAGAALK